MLRIFALSMILLPLLGCEPKQVSTWTRSELYFGLSRDGGAEVSDEEWQRFMVEAVTPRFPDGLTIVDATGQYRSKNGTLVQEKSKILIILRETTPEEDGKLNDIRKVYRARFGQEAVLKVDSPAAVQMD